MERRLLLLICVTVLVDTMLYAALAPLLPELEHEFGLSSPVRPAGRRLSARDAARRAPGRLARGAPRARRGHRRDDVMTGRGPGSPSLGGVCSTSRASSRASAARSPGRGASPGWPPGAPSAAARRSASRSAPRSSARSSARWSARRGRDGRGPTFLARCCGIVLALWALASRARPARGASAAGAPVPPALLLGGLADVVAALASGSLEVLVPLRLDVLGATARARRGVLRLGARRGADQPARWSGVADRRGANAIVRGGAAGRRGGARRAAAARRAALASSWSPSARARCDAERAAGLPARRRSGSTGLGVRAQQRRLVRGRGARSGGRRALGQAAATGSRTPVAPSRRHGAVAYGGGRRTARASAPPATFTA